MSGLINITDYCNTTANISADCDDYPEGVIFWISARVICLVLGFPGTVALLLDMFQKRRGGTPFTPNDVFVLNITVMDGVYFSFIFFIFFTSFLPDEDSVHKVIFTFLISFSLCGRPAILTCVSVDSYLAVVHPVTYRARKSLTPRVMAAVGVWAVTVFIGTLSVIVPNGFFMLFSTIFFYSLTMPVIAFCDFCILWTLKRSNLGGRDVHPQKRKALKIIISNLVIIFISYVPPLFGIFVFHFLNMDVNIKICLIVIPMRAVTLFGNTISLILHLNNLGKLDWLKCLKQR